MVIFELKEKFPYIEFKIVMFPDEASLIILLKLQLYSQKEPLLSAIIKESKLFPSHTSLTRGMWKQFSRLSLYLDEHSQFRFNFTFNKIKTESQIIDNQFKKKIPNLFN